MILKKPKSLILQQQQQKQQEQEKNLKRFPKRKRTVKSYALGDATNNNGNSDNDSDFDDDHGSKKHCTLNALSGAPIKNLWPLSRIPKDYDAKAVLTKKFQVPMAADKDNNSIISNSFGARRTLGMRRRPGSMNRLLYDPNAEDVIILWDPKEEEELQRKRQEEEEAAAIAAARGTTTSDSETDDEQTVVEEESKKEQKPLRPGKKSLSEILGFKKEESKKAPVMLDPVLTRILRPHQLDGLKFLYRCTTGKVQPDAFG